MHHISFTIDGMVLVWQRLSSHLGTGYDRSTDQTDKSADLSEFADYRYYRSDKPLYRIGIGSADYKGPYRLIGMGIKRAHIGANLVKFEPLKYI